MARRFVFTLEAALQQRVRQEQAAQLALAQTVAACRMATTRLATLEADAAAQARATSALAFDAQAQMNTLYYLDYCRRSIEQQRQVVRHWGGEIERARLAVVTASQRRQALERLRERQQTLFTVEMQRRADAELDEWVTSAPRPVTLHQEG